MSMKIEQDFAEAAEAFAAAAVKLLRVMEKDHTGAYFTGGYPFEKDFREVVDGIQQWRDAQAAPRKAVADGALRSFLNGIRVIWCLDTRTYLGCINKEDREHFGDAMLGERFEYDRLRAFAALPTQDQERVFALVQEANAKAGLSQ